MTHITYQGLLRSLGGRKVSVPDKRTGKEVRVLPFNPSGVIQLVVSKSMPLNTSVELGMIPAGFVLQKLQMITPATAGSGNIHLPAYDNLPKFDITDPAGGAYAFTGTTAFTIRSAAQGVSFPIDRPVAILMDGIASTGLFRLGYYGFPADDATKGSI